MKQFYFSPRTSWQTQRALDFEEKEWHAVNIEKCHAILNFGIERIIGLKGNP